MSVEGSKATYEQLPSVEGADWSPGAKAKTSAFPTDSATITAVLVTINILMFSAFQFNLSHPIGISLADWSDNIAPLTIGGQWWRLITSLFMHKTWSHLLENMLELLLLGYYMERLLGRSMFLLFYFESGLIGGLSILALIPGADAFGASLSTLGLAGGLIGVYSSRLGTLSGRAKSKLGALIFLAAVCFYAEISSSQNWNPGHLVSLLIGVFLGALFETQLGAGARFRYAVFAWLGLLMIIAFICIHRSNRFELPVYAAEMALSAGDERSALREVKAGLQMKPQDAWANRVAAKIFYNASDFQSAERSLTVALQADPEDEESSYLYGLVSVQGGHCAKARMIGEHLAGLHTLSAATFAANLQATPCWERTPPR